MAVCMYVKLHMAVNIYLRAQDGRRQDCFSGDCGSGDVVGVSGDRINGEAVNGGGMRGADVGDCGRGDGVDVNGDGISGDVCGGDNGSRCVPSAPNMGLWGQMLELYTSNLRNEHTSPQA